MIANPSAATLARTPGLALGPYYPLRPSSPVGIELWASTGPDGPGVQPVEICGRVVNVAGDAVAAAWVEAWQADEFGRYLHPSAPAPAPLDAGFAGYAAQRTDAQGRYRFRTLKPGIYVEGQQSRAPHIHFQVTAAHDRLVTQMFFPSEPLNSADRWYSTTRHPHRLVAAVAHRTPRSLRLVWDIVLLSG